MKTILKLIPLGLATTLALNSCVVDDGGVLAPAVGVGYYSALPPGYSGDCYFCEGRYYYGGRYETGRYYHSGRYYDNRYYHQGHYLYGGRHQHHDGHHR